MENKKKTQKEFVKAELAKKGFITRNAQIITKLKLKDKC